MANNVKAILLLAGGLAALLTIANYFFGDFISAGGGVYLTENKGESWRQFGRADSGNLGRANITAIEYNPADERIMYLGTLGSGLFKTVDGGANWMELGNKAKTLSPRASVYSIAADYTRPAYKKKIPDRFYVAAYQASYGRIFKTEDGGLTFKEVYTAARPNYAVFTVKLDPRRPHIVWAGTGAGALLDRE